MPLSWNEIRARALVFSREWKVTEEGEKIDYRLALYRTPDEEEGEDATLKKILSSKVVREGIRSFAKKVRAGAA